MNRSTLNNNPLEGTETTSPTIRRRKRTVHGMKTSHRLNYRESIKYRKDWREKQRARAFDSDTPSVSKYMNRNTLNNNPREGNESKKLPQDSVETVELPVFIFDPG